MLNHYRLKKLKKRRAKKFLDELHLKMKFLNDLDQEPTYFNFPGWTANEHFYDEIIVVELKKIRKRLEQILAEMKFPINTENKEN